MRTTEFIINELRLIINVLGHFPTRREIAEIDKGKPNKSKILGDIHRNGGINHFRKIMGYSLVRQSWDEERIIIELNKVIDDTGHFPESNELLKEKNSLRNAIGSNGGFNYFRKKLGYEVIRNRDQYSEEYIIDKLNSIVDATGEFPIIDSLRKEPYFAQLIYHGGINHFRKIMKYDLSRERWDEDKFIAELNNVVSGINKFPTSTDLLNMRNFGLLNAIRKRGGFEKVKERFSSSFPEAIMENKRSEIASYISKRGNKTEKIVKKIIVEWCYVHNLPQPEFNVKLAKSNVIEFVCESDLRIGIDVTNTKSRYGGGIIHKWRKKQYHLHLDELWIVVFSDVYNDLDYVKFNKQSPENVKVMSIETFMEELQISIDKDLQLKIENYNVCTFRNKSDFSRPKLGLSKFFKIKPDIRTKNREVKSNIDKNQKV